MLRKAAKKFLPSFLIEAIRAFMTHRKLSEITDEEVRILVRGVKIKIGICSALEKWRCDTYETKEPETLDWIDQMKPGDILYDIGANIGLYSLYAALRSRCRVYAFEPESQNFARLVKNCYRNHLTNITPYCIALGDKLTLDILYVTEMIAGDSQHSFGTQKNDYGRKYSFKQGSICMPLDDLCFTFGMPIPNYIKVDVDGLEKEIIKGSQKVLLHEQLRSVLIEINRRDGEENFIEEILKRSGFTLKNQAKREFRNENFSARNYIFER